MPDGSTPHAETGQPGAGQVRRGRKFDQVLAGAREVFLGAGFEGANVDDIARAAGVSKATLYSYFPDKRLLFLEVAKSECARQADQAMSAIDMTAPVAVVLRAVAEHMFGFISSNFGQRIYRICVAEAERFPDVARDFYHSGPGLARMRIAAFLSDATERGEVAIADANLAADQFQGLCKAGVFDRMIFDVTPAPEPGVCAQMLDEAVAMFMARYGVSDASSANRANSAVSSGDSASLSSPPGRPLSA